MRPDEHELDDEIRGHLALSIKERIERGEDPEAARLAALREFGYVPATREAMRRVWYSRWFDALTALCAGHARRPALAAARQGPRRHRRHHPRPRHRRQRRDLQRGARRAAAPAGQSRRGSPGLHPPERAGRRHREHDVLGGRRSTTSRRAPPPSAPSAISRPSSSRCSAPASRACCRPASSAGRISM